MPKAKSSDCVRVTILLLKLYPSPNLPPELVVCVAPFKSIECSESLLSVNIPPTTDSTPLINNFKLFF